MENHEVDKLIRMVKIMYDDFECSILEEVKFKITTDVKGAQSRLNGLKSLAKLFKIRCLQSVSIFSILNHPCSIMVYYYLFDVFLSL